MSAKPWKQIVWTATLVCTQIPLVKVAVQVVLLANIRAIQAAQTARIASVVPSIILPRQLLATIVQQDVTRVTRHKLLAQFVAKENINIKQNRPSAFFA
jgi:hypothetical protein